MEYIFKTVLCIEIFFMGTYFPQAQVVFPKTYSRNKIGIPLKSMNGNFASHDSQKTSDIGTRGPSSPGSKPLLIERNPLQVIFPGNSKVGTTPLSGAPNDGNCPILSGKMYYKGVCSQLLDTCDMNESLWLVVNQNGLPSCVQRSCPRGLLRHKGRCVKPVDEPVCGKSEILYVELTGQVVCDCEPSLIYDKGLGQCMTEHSQGSCPKGQFLELQEREVTCVVNNCPTDSLVYNPENGQCYTKLFEGLCRRAKGTLKFNDKSLTATCAGVETRNVFEVPALTSCPKGSKRDPLGRCQIVFRANSPMALRVPTQHRSRFSVCPRGYVRLPNGICRKTNDLFG